MASLRKKRLEFLQSIDNDTNYYIPLEYLDKFLTDPKINIEQYRNKFNNKSTNKLTNYEKDLVEDMYAIEYFKIKNECIDEYSLKNNDYFYKGDVFLDESFYDWKYNCNQV